MSRSGNARIKAYAQQLITEHTAANRRLAPLLTPLRLRPPTALDTPKKADLDALQTKQGQAFDRAYLTTQVSAHEQAVNLFTAYSKSNGSAALRSYATSTLPALKKHLQTARDLLKSLTQ